MNTTKNADCVTAQERLELARRESDRRPNWAAVAAVLALTLLAYNDVRWRDQLVAEREQHALELAARDRELARYKPAPQAGRCREYTVSMEGWAATHCTKPGIRM